MTHLLFNLSNVPDDEADEVRQLLHQHGLAFYETDAGRWKSGVAAIWLDNAEQLEEARRLLTCYQQERQQRAQSAFEQQRARGEVLGIGARLRADPLRFGATLTMVALAITAIAGLMIIPFFGYLS